MEAPSQDAPSGANGDAATQKGEKMHHLVLLYLTRRAARGELAAGTVIRMRSTLIVFAAIHGNRPIDQLGRRTIERWLEERAPRVKPGTLRLEFGVVRTFCRWLVLEGKVRRDPTVGMRPPRVPRAVPRALPAASVAAALAACPGPRERLVLWLMVGLGLRRAEVADLQMGDIDRAAGIVRVRGKGGHERELPLTPEVAKALDDYLADAGDNAGPVIRSKTNGVSGIRADTVGIIVYRIMRHADVRGSAHAFRHTCLSDVAEATKDLRMVQGIAGHQSLSTTQIYLRRAQLAGMREALSGRSYDGAA